MDYLRRTWAEINLNALDHNINEIKKLLGKKEIIAVVKANAYGHDDDIICTELFKLGISTFAVSNLWEAQDLRKIVPSANILIFGYTEEAYFDSIIDNNFIHTVGSVDFANRLNSYARSRNTRIKIHIKIDTGMSRVGIDTPEELNEILAMENLECEAMLTHFSVSDGDTDGDMNYTITQQNKFTEITKGVNLPIHSQNSGGTLYHTEFAGDMVRAGLLMYGYYPSDILSSSVDLKPVMTLKSAVSQLKTIKAGTDISYGRTYTAKADIITAVVPVGYADGYSRALSNKGKVLIRGKACPIVGRVCMDQIVVDVSEVGEVKVGDVAELYSANSLETSIPYIANLLDTIPYELTCSVGHRVPRVAVRDGKVQIVVRYG